MTDEVRPSSTAHHPFDVGTLLRFIAGELSELIFAIDPSGVVTYLSPASERLVGWRADEVMGRHFSEFVSADSAAAVREALRGALTATQTVRGLRLTFRRKDGTTFAAQLDCGRLMDGDRLAGVFGSLRDVTDRERAEAALCESEQRYRVLFEAISDAVFVNEIEPGNVPGRFLQVNDVACRRLGYARDELLALTPRDISTPEAFSTAAESRDCLAERGSVLLETVHVTKDGRQIPVESHIRYVQYLGRSAALSISRDLTDRRRAEEERLEMERRLLQVQKL